MEKVEKVVIGLQLKSRGNVFFLYSLKWPRKKILHRINCTKEEKIDDFLKIIIYHLVVLLFSFLYDLKKEKKKKHLILLATLQDSHKSSVFVLDFAAR